MAKYLVDEYVMHDVTCTITDLLLLGFKEAMTVPSFTTTTSVALPFTTSY